MRKIAPISFNFIYSPQEESELKLQTAYSRIFALARQRIIDKNNAQKYIQARPAENLQQIVNRAVQ